MRELQTLVFVGTYTTRLGHVDGKADGLSVYELDMTSGALNFFGELKGLENPAYLALAPDGKHLYVANETESGEVTACEFDRTNAALRVLNQQAAQGSYPCHIALHDNGRYAFVANYGAGNLTAFPIEADGRLGKATDHIQHKGSSINLARQDAAHAHCVLLDNENNHVFVADLGLDKIMKYDFDPDQGLLSAAKQVSVDVKAGAGVRHLAFHPDGKRLFAIHELDSTISLFAYHRASHELNLQQTISTLPHDFQGQSFCAAIHVHPSGRFVYGSNRGHDSLAIFGFDQKTGRLEARGQQSTKGRTPRDFAIDPSGTFLLAANQDSDTIVSFRIDLQTGQLQDTGRVLETPTPVCLKIVAY